MDACLLRLASILSLGLTCLAGAAAADSAVLVRPLGDARPSGAPREPDWTVVLRHPSAKLHLYGKREARPGRKMGHVTVLADAVDEAVRVAVQIERELGIGQHGVPVGS